MAGSIRYQIIGTGMTGCEHIRNIDEGPPATPAEFGIDER